MLNNNAQPKLSTRNPGTRPDVSKISNALITKVNNPSVRMVIGSVRRKSNGFIVTLIIPRISAAIIAGVKPAMWTPWGKKAVINIASAFRNQRIKSFTLL